MTEEATSKSVLDSETEQVLMAGFSLGLDDMEGGQVQGDKAVIGGGTDGEGHILYWGGPILRIVFNPKR